MVGREEVEWAEGTGGKPEAGLSFHMQTDSSAVSSVSDRKGLNPLDRSTQSLATVWHQSHPYWCHSLAPQTLYCTIVVSQGRQDAFSESRLGHL